MKVFQINICPDLSTGNVMMGIAAKARERGVECITASAPKSVDSPITHITIGNNLERKLHLALGKIIGCEFAFSYFSTCRLIKKIKKFNPDIIHLHNLHAYYLNLNVLFKYLKNSGKKIVWTLHDCWAFTGHCPYFDMIGCEKWKTVCYNCPQYKKYPKSIIDTSKYKYKIKNRLINSIKELIIVTPSQWLADLVKQSFLKEYPVKVINNGINLDVFRPTESNFRKKYNCEEKFILLGVAFGWGKRKGLDVFIGLSKRLDDRFQIVLVGTDENVDKQLPDNIISIHRTQNQKELAEIYTAADLFVNPTREENYPTVNMEAIACGTPVLTFNTGGSPEILDETCGSVVAKNDIVSLYNEIMRICNGQPFTEEGCLKRANSFDMKKRFEEYVKLYNLGEPYGKD